jgi:acetylornithine deacetylase
MEAKDILKKLVEYDTYKDNKNKEILDYIQNLLIQKGFKVDYRSKCLVMSINDNYNLGFVGHTDTVQSGNDWKYNPLKLTEIENKLYGLGVCDMKGGIAAILKTVLDINWEELNYGIKLIFTYDEEINFSGIKEIMNEKIKIPENIIIGEPTNNEILTGSKGLLEFEMEFKGKSAHSSNPSKGINAIENCMDFLGELKRFYEFLKSEIDERFEIPYTTMNIRKNNWWKKYKYSSK